MTSLDGTGFSSAAMQPSTVQERGNILRCDASAARRRWRLDGNDSRKGDRAMSKPLQCPTMGRSRARTVLWVADPSPVSFAPIQPAACPIAVVASLRTLLAALPAADLFASLLASTSCFAACRLQGQVSAAMRTSKLQQGSRLMPANCDWPERQRCHAVSQVRHQVPAIRTALSIGILRGD